VGEAFCSIKWNGLTIHHFFEVEIVHIY